MKQIAIILSIILICGCDNKSREHEINMHTNPEYRDKYMLQQIKNNLRYITIDDHEYIWFRLPQRTYGYNIDLISLCHSPKCKCLKKND